MKDFSYNVPACWREVPINVDAWLTDYEPTYKEGQGGLYELKFITQLEVKIPNHKAALATLGKIQDDSENETLSLVNFVGLIVLWEMKQSLSSGESIL